MYECFSYNGHTFLPENLDLLITHKIIITNWMTKIRPAVFFPVFDHVRRQLYSTSAEPVQEISIDQGILKSPLFQGTAA
jgi:hypothetical protein